MTTTPDDAPPPADPDGDRTEQAIEEEERTEREAADPDTGEPEGDVEAAVPPPAR
jgi:hypothetical protein